MFMTTNRECELLMLGAVSTAWRCHMYAYILTPCSASQTASAWTQRSFGQAGLTRSSSSRMQRQTW